jgi:F-type H+-transporting ATPase subunit a
VASTGNAETAHGAVQHATDGAAHHADKVIDPLHQFEIWSILDIQVAGLNLSFTNSSLWMVIASLVAFGVMWLGTRNAELVPGRMQAASEMLYGIVANMVRDNVGDEGKKYFPIIFALFMFVLFGNVLGMIPGSFTFTSHLAVTFFMAAVIFITVTVIGIVRHGVHFLRLFFPEGAPLWTAFILVPIELVSYFSRPLSLSVRLFANMLVGHMLLKVIGGFAVLMGAAGILPLTLLVGITALEFLVAALQAYVFTILTCIYLHDAIHLH